MTSTRILIGVLGLAVLLPAVVWGGPLAVEIIVLGAMIVAADEFARMALPDDIGAARLWLVVALGGVHAASLYGEPEQLVAVGGAITMGSMAFAMWRPGDTLDHAADRGGRLLVGIGWISLLPFLVRLRDMDDGVAWVILALAISWLSDTGAYFSGRKFGRRKLYELVSPNKTVEGLIGGMITAIVGVFVMRAFFLPQLTPLDAIVLGAVGSGVSVIGDLCESLLKRTYGVKDSGWILPGHGGMLDRIDSVLFVGPAVWIWASALRGL